jgi:hypothetical protein
MGGSVGCGGGDDGFAKGVPSFLGVSFQGLDGFFLFVGRHNAKNWLLIIRN